MTVERSSFLPLKGLGVSGQTSEYRASWQDCLSDLPPLGIQLHVAKAVDDKDPTAETTFHHQSIYLVPYQQDSKRFGVSSDGMLTSGTRNYSRSISNRNGKDPKT